MSERFRYRQLRDRELMTVVVHDRENHDQIIGLVETNIAGYHAIVDHVIIGAYRTRGEAVKALVEYQHRPWIKPRRKPGDPGPD